MSTANAAVGPSAQARPTMVRLQRGLVRVILYAALTVGLIIFVWPMAWLVSASLKPVDEVYMFPPNLIPSQIVWSNYTEALKLFNYLLSFSNTMRIVVGVIIGQLLSCSLTAFAFARIRVRFREPLFVLVLATMMLPYQVT